VEPVLPVSDTVGADPVADRFDDGIRIDVRQTYQLLPIIVKTMSVFIPFWLLGSYVPT